MAQSIEEVRRQAAIRQKRYRDRAKARRADNPDLGAIWRLLYRYTAPDFSADPDETRSREERAEADLDNLLRRLLDLSFEVTEALLVEHTGGRRGDNRPWRAEPELEGLEPAEADFARLVWAMRHAR